MMESTPSNASNVRRGLDFLHVLFRARFEEEYGDGTEIKLPELAYFGDGSALAGLLKQYEPSCDEYVVLILALLPHVAPGFLDRVLREALPGDGEYPEIGCQRSCDHRGLVATGETAVFLLAGSDLDRRFEVERLFVDGHWFAEESVLYLEATSRGEPDLSGRLMMDPDQAKRLTNGRVEPPRFSPAFPARQLSTDLEWADVVLGSDLQRDIQDIEAWIQHNDTLMRDWGMHRKLKPGYRALFHGGPGTGKTLTATLLGRYTNRPVFSVDSATVTSKYIGETSRNLAALFDQASSRDWILFFDEADALFGKRTEVKDAHDRYANQEAAYLLQRLESFDGLVVLATNLKSNLDDAFLRRFNKVIHFAFPAQEERAAIWRKLVPDRVKDASDMALFERFAEYKLAGGAIINVVQHACLRALADGRERIEAVDLHTGVRAEFEKEGRVFEELEIL